MRLVVTKSFESGSRFVADMYAETVRNKPDALLGCATGSSPEGIYACMVADQRAGLADYAEARTVNLDEYVGLGASHPQSFAYYMEENLFRHVPIRQENIFLMDGAGEPREQIDRLNAFLSENVIDMLMLGVGGNGHIGFNEPGPCFHGPAHVVELSEDTIRTNSRFFGDAAQVPRRAMTMGMYGIATARRIALIASGAAKAQAIRGLLTGEEADPALPCSILHLCRDVTVVIDEALYALVREDIR